MSLDMWRIEVFAALIIFATLMVSCGEERAYGPSEVADLVAILKPGLSDLEVDQFFRDSLSGVGDSEANPEGVKAVVTSKVGEQTAVLVFFQPSAGEVERSRLENRLNRSPFVDRLFKDAVANDLELSLSTGPG